MYFQSTFNRNDLVHIQKVSVLFLHLIVDATSSNPGLVRHPLVLLILLELRNPYLIILLFFSIWFIWSVCFCYWMQNSNHLSFHSSSAFVVLFTSSKHIKICQMNWKGPKNKLGKNHKSFYNLTPQFSQSHTLIIDPIFLFQFMELLYLTKMER